MEYVDYVSKVLAFFGLNWQKMPSSYLCLDLETTGLQFSYMNTWSSPDRDDLILQIGLLYVQNDSPVREQVWTLDWMNYKGGYLADFVKTKLQRLNDIYAIKKNKKWPITAEIVASGTDPLEALKSSWKLIQQWQENNGWVAGVNICSFDLKALQHSLAEWLEIWPEFRTDRLLDPGSLLKAWQMRYWPNPTHKSLGQFLCEVASVRAPGIRWGIDYMIEKLGLDSRLEQIGPLHTAPTDCVVTHYAINHLKEEARKHGYF